MSDPQHPGDAIRKRMEDRGWTQIDLARIIGRTPVNVNEIIKGKVTITAETAALLSAAFGDADPAYWLALEAQYRLADGECDVAPVKRRVRLYELAPINDMERRGWIAPTKDAQSLESELRKFFEVDDLDNMPPLSVVTRKSGANANETELTPKQRAWCFRVKQLGKAPPASNYNEDSIPALRKKLRELAAFPSETKYVAETLSDFGIRFVIVQPIPGSHIEGVTIWNADDAPVIGMSLLHDRLDSFWHTLMHEVSHVAHRDSSIDVLLTGEAAEPTIAKNPVERRADAEACASLIPPKELESFIGRVAPLYYREKIIGFAHRIKIHPSIIIGQLQHLGELKPNRLKELTPKVRELITPTALTDGYGSTIA